MVGGRQREFDKQEALEQAMRVFWNKGYVGSSLMDLTTSMGINKPSMYAAFGNKEALFIQATQNYIDHYASIHAQLLQATDLSIKQRLSAYLLSVVKSQSGMNGPKGCLITSCIAEAAGEDMPESATKKVNEIKNLGEKILTDFFNQAENTALFKHQQSSQQLAQYFITVLHGTAAMSRAGKTLAELTVMIELSLTVLDQE